MDLKVKDVRRAHLSDLLNAIVDRGAQVMANRTLPVIKNLFLYAVERGHIEESPTVLLSRKSTGGREKPKERALSVAEIRAVWALLEDTERFRASWQVSGAIKMLLLTGQRIGETLLTRWEHIDPEIRVWNIPAENAKVRAHLVHLSPQALGLLHGSGWLWIRRCTSRPARLPTISAGSRNDFFAVRGWTLLFLDGTDGTDETPAAAAASSGSV